MPNSTIITPHCHEFFVELVVSHQVNVLNNTHLFVEPVVSHQVNVLKNTHLFVESVVSHQVNVLNAIAIVHLNVTATVLQLIHLYKPITR